MSKLSSLAKDSYYGMDMANFNDEKDLFVTAFMKGFEAAFKEIEDQAIKKIAHLEQYPMMSERIFALKTYISTMDDMLEDMKQ